MIGVLAFGLAVLLFSGAPSPAHAQTGGALGWCTIKGPGVEQCGFSDPQAACALQWTLYAGSKPLHIYSDTANWWSKQCHWEKALGESFPAQVTYRCDTGYGRIPPFYCGLSGDNFPSAECIPCQAAADHGGTATPLTPYPIAILDGGKTFEREDFATADGGLRAGRFYASRPVGGGSGDYVAPPLGFANWRFALGMELQLGDAWSTSSVAGLATPEGAQFRFVKSGSVMIPEVTTARPVKQTDYTLEYVGTLPASAATVLAAPSDWIVRDRRNRTWYLTTDRNRHTGTFNVARPTRLVEPNGLELAFQYADGALLSVTDSYGRTLTFSWIRVEDLPRAISEIGLPDGTTLNFTYESLTSGSGLPDRLASVERRQGATVLDKESYDHGDTRYPTLVTGVHDAGGVLRWSVTYDDFGRALTSSGPGGTEAYAVAYGASGATFTRTVTGPLGKVETYTFARTGTNMNLKLSSVSAAASPNSPASSQSKTYTGSYIGSETDAEGRVTGYTRDTLARPTQIVEAQGTALARTTNITWHGTWDAPTQTAAPGLTTNDTLVTGSSGGDAPPPTYVASQVFAYSGAAASYTVPSGVTTATVRLWGGGGGNGNYSAGAWSGAGGYVEATFAVAPGDALSFEVAGGGAGVVRAADGGAGGWPDGGPGGKGNYGSGGGGGSTRFYINGVLKAVAGGGGGSGGADNYGVAGGGGGASGRDGDDDGGSGGTPTGGGVDKSNNTNANKTGRSIVAFPGVQRTGGFGSSTGGVTTGEGGGGGGGGYWGGGGGGGTIGYGQPGGGGSSWIDAGASIAKTYPGFGATAFSPPSGQPTVARGVNSQTNGVAVPGGDGYAMVGLK